MNNHLDSLLTVLDAKDEQVLIYPKMTMKNKTNHNPHFNRYMTKNEKQDYLDELRPEIENKMRTKINYVASHSQGHQRDYDTLKEHLDKLVPPHLLSDAQKNQWINRMYQYNPVYMDTELEFIKAEDPKEDKKIEQLLNYIKK